MINIVRDEAGSVFYLILDQNIYRPEEVANREAKLMINLLGGVNLIIPALSNNDFESCL
jgi:hypothetical protein